MPPPQMFMTPQREALIHDTATMYFESREADVRIPG